MPSHILFLCALGSSRSLLAASILLAKAGDRWDVWSTPAQDIHGRELAARVLHEHGLPLISLDHLIQPTSRMHWNEGIILCSGATNT